MSEYTIGGEIPPFHLINYSVTLRKCMNFKIYSKENCPYCYKVKTVLELTGTNFQLLKLNEDFTKEEFYSEFGEGSTFPQVICDENKIGGCVDTIKFLRERQVIKS